MIPRLIHQTFPTKLLPEPLRENQREIQSLNPGWQYQLYDDDDILEFLYTHYGPEVVKAYSSLDERYGAARADLFRYLLMYKVGGVYLDVKSTSVKPFERVMPRDLEYVLSQWPNKPGERFQGSGLHPELNDVQGGEFEQWYIISRPEHPFLKAVVDRVLRNIAAYRPWGAGVGRSGVLRLTGPIAYTLAIAPIRGEYRHWTLTDHEEIGLRYNVLGTLDHRRFFNSHYTYMDHSIVKPRGINRVAWGAYTGMRRIKHRLLRPNEVP